MRELLKKAALSMLLLGLMAVIMFNDIIKIAFK